MARSYGAATHLLINREITYGAPVIGNFEQVSFVSSSLGAEQNLIASNLLGQGREPRAPFRDVINDSGDIVVPIDCRDFGRWLQFLMGDPVTSAVAATGAVTFTANPDDLDSITLNGVNWVFVSGPAGTNQTQIGATLADTLTELANNLNASAHSGIIPALYTSTTTTLTITYATTGISGNSYTLVSAQANAVVSSTHLTGGGYSHVYKSGASILPSFCTEIGHHNVPVYFQHHGCMLDSMQLNFQRSGGANATLNVIAQGETHTINSQGGTPTSRPFKAFSQFMGFVKRNGIPLGNVTGAQFTYSNGMEAIPVLRNDAFIDGVDPTQITANGTIDVRFADNTLIDDAINDQPIELELGYQQPELGSNFALRWVFHSVYLPRPKIAVTGPGGVQASFNWQAGFNETTLNSTTVTLTNDVASYA